MEIVCFLLKFCFGLSRCVSRVQTILQLKGLLVVIDLILHIHLFPVARILFATQNNLHKLPLEILVCVKKC